MDVRRRLLLASAHMLFLELALIRWTGSNVVHLSYFANFVLLGSFLGIGLGVLVSRRERSVLPLVSPVVLTALVALVLAFPVQVNQASSDVIYFTSVRPGGPPPWLALPLIFVAVATVMAGPGEVVGRCFRELPGLEAYRLDLAGSLLGIVTFTLLSFLRAPSFVWGSIAAIGYLVLLPSWRRVVAVTGVVLVGLLVAESLATGVTWSPYYKVKTREGAQARGGAAVNIAVNGVPHQDIRPAAVQLERDPRYGLPYERMPDVPLDRVLIVGAGNGNDVAIALKQGAKHVDAVEIDPRLLQIGRELHPDRPYADPRVTTHVDDGRAFLERSDRTWDLILFALPDSLTIVTGASSIRLESYLFTEQSMKSVRDHLADGGGFGMYNNYRQSWLVSRLANTAEQAFGHAPCVDTFGNVGRQAVISVGLSEQTQKCAQVAQVRADAPEPATDDHPFLYLRHRGIPAIYLVTLLGVLLVSLLAVRAVAGPFRGMRPYADLFFMGTAFLLIETKYVTGFALLFGTTWVVNAIVFGGVLVAVLLAVEATRRFRTPDVRVLYGLLAASLALAWLLPATRLLSLPLVPRLVAAIAVAFAPVFLANVIFAKRFAEVGDSATAFATNLLGAMVGGCLEYVALIVGYNALLIVAAVLYGLAFLLLPRAARVPAIPVGAGR